MPLPAIGAAAARAGAAAGRVGASIGQAAKGVARKPQKPASAPPAAGGMPVSQIKFDRLLSVEGILIITTAVLIDVLGLVDAIPIIGTFLSYVFDIVGLLLIGSWLVFGRGEAAPSLREARATREVVGPVTKVRGSPRLGKILARGGCIIGEFIPVLGILPFWTGLVLFELLTED